MADHAYVASLEVLLEVVFVHGGGGVELGQFPLGHVQEDGRLLSHGRQDADSGHSEVAKEVLLEFLQLHELVVDQILEVVDNLVGPEPIQTLPDYFFQGLLIGR